MRYRKQDANGDYVFGHGSGDFYVDSPDAVAQAIKTRLRLWAGEYFLDTTQGMPWQFSVLGYHPSSVYDPAIRSVIEGTDGFLNFVNYKSSLNSVTRVLTVNALVNSVYSGIPIQISQSLSGYGIGGYGEGGYGGD